MSVDAATELSSVQMFHIPIIARFKHVATVTSHSHEHAHIPQASCRHRMQSRWGVDHAEDVVKSFTSWRPSVLSISGTCWRH